MCESSEYVMRGGEHPLDSFADVGSFNSTKSEARNIEVTLPISANEAGILVLSEPSLPYPVDVHQVMVIEGLHSALPTYVQQGCSIVVEPFECHGGTCTVLQDDLGTRICLIEPNGHRRKRRSPSLSA